MLTILVGGYAYEANMTEDLSEFDGMRSKLSAPVVRTLGNLQHKGAPKEPPFLPLPPRTILPHDYTHAIPCGNGCWASSASPSLTTGASKGHWAGHQRTSAMAERPSTARRTASPKARLG